MKNIEVIGVGATLDDAKNDAVSKLGKEYDNIEFEVIQMPEKKVFGIFGGSEAKVKAIVTETGSKEAKKFLLNIIEKFDIKNLDVKENEKDNGVIFDINGDDIGSLIGYRGETLNALQYLTGLVANKSNDSFYRVTINVGDYRKKRDKSLELLAKKNAFRALKIRRNVYLEPMNSYERRIIHTAVQDINGVKSWSEGEKRDRHVVIGIDNTAKNSSTKLKNIDDKHSLYEKIN